MFEAARRHGVRRVVFASSNHAAGFTPGRGRSCRPTARARPDTLYGVSKVFGEALGRYYADRYGLQVACLRIGTFAGSAAGSSRALATWLSPDDCARLVDACLRAENLSYALLWGVSANTRRTWWSLDEAYALGYRPRDDAEAFAGARSPRARTTRPTATSAAGSPRPGSASTRWRAVMNARRHVVEPA